MRALLTWLIALACALPLTAHAGSRMSARGTPSVIVDVTASSDAALATAFVVANKGKVLRLSGTYGFVNACGNFAPAIQLVSLDPNNPAEIQGFEPNGCSGIVTHGIKFTSANQRYFTSLALIDATNVTIDGGEITSSVTPTMAHVARSNEGGTGGYAGVNMDGSKNVSITNVRIHHVNGAIGAVRSSAVTLSGNYFHDIYHNDIMNLSILSGIRVERNRARDYYFCGNAEVVASACAPEITNPALAEHGDFAQIYAVSGPSGYIDFRSNMFVRGAGSIPQGIFLGNESSGTMQASFAGTTMTLAASGSGGTPTGHNPLVAGDLISCSGCLPQTYVVALLTGAGGALSTYQLSLSQSTMATRITGYVTWPYDTVGIVGNGIYGGAANGISCGACTNATATTNVVQAYTGQASEINWEGGFNFNLSGNSSTGYQVIVSTTSGTQDFTSGSNLSSCSACGPVF